MRTMHLVQRRVFRAGYTCGRVVEGKQLGQDIGLAINARELIQG